MDYSIKLSQQQFKELLQHIYKRGEETEKIQTADMIIEIKEKLTSVLEIKH